MNPLNFHTQKRYVNTILAATFAFGLASCSNPKTEALSQADLNETASKLQIKYEVFDNRAGEHCDPARAGGACFTSHITLSSDQALPVNGWSIFFSQVSPVQKAIGGNFTVEHINGDLHKLTPGSIVKSIDKDSPQVIKITSDFWHLSKSDVMPNYYLAPTDPNSNLRAKVIDSTRIQTDPETGLEVQNFTGEWNDTDRHLLRTPADLTNPATPALTWQQNSDTPQVIDRVNTAIIPTPSSITTAAEGSLDLSSGLRLLLQGFEADAVDAAMVSLAGMGFNASEAGVALTIERDQTEEKMPGSYSLVIGPEKIAIKAGDNEGASNALRSIASLIMPGATGIPFLAISDSPRYEFRGLHIDVARNFHSKQLILDILEQMAAYKLNKLHLHLGDDEGWRLQIDGLPELTEVGSRRCYDPLENQCLLPQLGSGPDVNAPVNGYYTNKDYIEILRYANARQIQVIPSFDMPGHSRAAVKSMEARYRKFMAKEDIAGAKQYLLSDPDDATRYQSVQFYTDNTINACMDSSYVFLDKVIEEIQQLHEQAGQTLTRYHIGADETAGAWVNSPLCQAFIADKSNGVHGPEDIGGYFIERVANMLAKRGIEPAGWSDGMGETRTENMPAVVQSNAWGTLFSGGYTSAHIQANRNWEIVVSTPDVTYFDAPYEVDPNEPGYYWTSRGTNTRKIFNFMPDNLPAHAELMKGRQGEDLTFDDSKEPLNAGVTFAGLQGHIWSETIRTDERVEYMLFPRLIALAERAWKKADWELDYDYAGKIYSADTHFFNDALKQQRDEEWRHFSSSLAIKYLPKLDRAGINYRIPTPGAIVNNAKLEMNSIFPGLPMDYRLNGGQWIPWHTAVELNTGDQVEVRGRSADGKRKGRAWSLN